MCLYLLLGLLVGMQIGFNCVENVFRLFKRISRVTGVGLIGRVFFFESYDWDLSRIFYN